MVMISEPLMTMQEQMGVQQQQLQVMMRLEMLPLQSMHASMQG